MSTKIYKLKRTIKLIEKRLEVELKIIQKLGQLKELLQIELRKRS